MKFLQILVLILGLAAFASAQKTILSGTVYDSNGAVILGTKINATNNKGQNFETTVDTDGNYSLEIPVGIYTLEFNAANFEKVKFENYTVVNSSSEKMSLDISLNVSGDGIVCILTVESPKTNKSISNKNQEINL